MEVEIKNRNTFLIKKKKAETHFKIERNIV
jgi:hypothetical protein